MLQLTGVMPMRPIRLLVLSGLLFIGTVVVAAALLLSNLQERALAEKTRELDNIVRLLSEHTDRALRATENIQNSLIERMQMLGVSLPEDYEHMMSGHDAHLFLREKVAGWPHIGSLTLINSKGKLFNFSRFWPLPSIDVTDREFFKVLKSNPELKTFMGEPVRNRATDTWTIHLVRTVVSPKGDFLGLILGAMEMQYFEQYFGTINLEQQSSISLFRDDGILLASHPAPDPAKARSYAQNAGLMDILNTAKQAAVERTSAIDTVNQLVVARRLEHYPFILMARMPVAGALSGWTRELQFVITAAVILIIIAGSSIFLGVRQFRNYDRLWKARTDRGPAELFG
jgi:hypothetical protein